MFLLIMCQPLKSLFQNRNDYYQNRNLRIKNDRRMLDRTINLLLKADAPTLGDCAVV